MRHSLFSLASALTVSLLVSSTSAAVAGISPREVEFELDKRLVCVGDTINEIFSSVGMGNATDGAKADTIAFCRSWIDIPNVTSYILTVTPTT
jgi:hypothetical protein